MSTQDQDQTEEGPGHEMGIRDSTGLLRGVTAVDLGLQHPGVYTAVITSVRVSEDQSELSIEYATPSGDLLGTLKHSFEPDTDNITDYQQSATSYLQYGPMGMVVDTMLRVYAAGMDLNALSVEADNDRVLSAIIDAKVHQLESINRLLSQSHMLMLEALTRLKHYERDYGDLPALKH